MQLRALATFSMVWLLAACGGSGPTTLEFQDLSPLQPRIGEIVTVRFKLLDERGLPLAGQQVDFKLQAPNSAVTLSPVSVQSLKGSGFAEVQLQAANRVNSVIVVATAGNKSVLSPPITFAGAVPNAVQLTFQCGPISGEASGGRHAIGAFDQSRNLIAGVKLECTAHVGDRNGDGVSGALVSFLTEAGTIGPTETSLTNVIGNATILYKTSLPLPKDVEPENWTWTPPSGATQTGEYLVPLWMEAFLWVSNPVLEPPPAPLMNPREPSRLEQLPGRRNKDGSAIRMNPRDNLVSMIAVTSGEEAFSDNNNNGKWDPEEPYTDLTEPFVDTNDNGTWDQDERFIDVNGDLSWTGKNSRWDANTLIWVQERILWTGIPHRSDALAPSPVVGAFNPAGPYDFTCPAMGFCSQATPNAGMPPSYHRFKFRLSDPWYNSIAQNAESDGCGVDDGVGVGQPGGSPVVVQTLGGPTAGVPFTYPSGRIIELTISDRRDPTTPPAEQIPARRPPNGPVGYSVAISCEYTASPIGGHVVRLVAGDISGTIE
jgi:hypothetical protein